MNWYKIAKSIKEIAWDGGSEETTSDDWDNTKKDSDLGAIMLRMYRRKIDPDEVDEEDIEDTVSGRKSGEGELGMWSYFEINEPEYLEELKFDAKKKYKKFYKDTKDAEEGIIPMQDEQQGMPGGDMGGDMGGMML